MKADRSDSNDCLGPCDIVRITKQKSAKVWYLAGDLEKGDCASNAWRTIVKILKLLIPYGSRETLCDALASCQRLVSIAGLTSPPPHPSASEDRIMQVAILLCVASSPLSSTHIACMHSTGLSHAEVSISFPSSSALHERNDAYASFLLSLSLTNG